jgi:hypothetical protein
MKWYLGFLTKDTVEIFRSSKTPTKALVPFYHRAVGPYASEDAAKRDARRQRVVLKNPGEVDSVSARELELYIENNGDLYRQMYTPVVNNLLRKMKKGTYNPILAEKGWLYLVDEGARRYNKEFGNGSLSLKLFDVPTRKEVARRFARSFEKEVEIGGYKLNPKPKKNPPLMVIGNPGSRSKLSRVMDKISHLVSDPTGTLRIVAQQAIIDYPQKTSKQIALIVLKEWNEATKDFDKENPPLMVIGNPPKRYYVIVPDDETRGVPYRVVSYNQAILERYRGQMSQSYSTKKAAQHRADYLNKFHGEKTNPPDSLMSDSVHEVRYTHRKDGHPYKHTFKPGVRMRANEDGTITMYHPTKRIHEEFPE